MEGGRAEGPDALENVASLLGGFFGTWVMNVGYRSGLLERIRAQSGSSVDELAEATGYERRYIDGWCRAAYAFHLLELNGDDRFSLAAGVESVLLDSSAPAFMGGRTVFFPTLTPDFEMLPDRMGDGATYPLAERSSAFVAGLDEATRADAPNMVANVIPTQPELEAALGRGGRLLDAGCGAGHSLLHFSEAYPDAELVGIANDPRTVQAARERLGDRARVELMELGAPELRDGFDLVCANVSLSHMWGTGGEAFEGLLAALRPGGWVLVSEVPYPEDVEDLRSPKGRMFVGVTTYVALLGFDLITPTELLERLRATGFADVHIVDQPAPTRVMALARRPPAKEEDD